MRETRLGWVWESVGFDFFGVMEQGASREFLAFSWAEHLWKSVWESFQKASPSRILNYIGICTSCVGRVGALRIIPHFIFQLPMELCPQVPLWAGVPPHCCSCHALSSWGWVLVVSLQRDKAAKTEVTTQAPLLLSHCWFCLCTPESRGGVQPLLPAPRRVWFPAQLRSWRDPGTAPVLVTGVSTVTPLSAPVSGRAPPGMSCSERCAPCAPTPLANGCAEPCVRQCQDSTVLIQPSPVLVTLPGPILSSFPQSTTVGSSASAALGSALSAGGVPIGSGGSLGLGGFGCPGLGAGYNRPSRRPSTFRGGFYGPC
ncbi:uncharacterized protein LOC135403944 [Pseudopipra pipra]|uniref:uncharacterized protein LOC135403944 n=1 Tax=Pseudopipra pipra TaxID=415032 RepID=UPI0031398C0C